MKTLNRDISARIIALREKAKLSRTQLAVRARISTTFIGMLERGERLPSLEQLEILADVFNVSMGSFLGSAEKADPAMPIVLLARRLKPKQLEVAMSFLATLESK